MMTSGEVVPFSHVSDLFSLQDKNILISGAGSIAEGVGIGRAAAVVLAAAGACVGLIDRNRAAAAESLRMVHSVGGRGSVYEADVTDDAGVAAAVRAFVASYGQVDALVNNVGIAGPRGTAEDVDLDAWDAGMAINVRSVVLMSRHAVAAMPPQGGSIVNIGSIAGMGGGYPSLFYPTSKGAIINLSRSMAAHFGPRGVRVNVVAPGQLLTPRILARHLTDEMRRRRVESTVLGTEGTGWDAAYAILYLISPAAQWVTGIVLPVDAGVTAMLPLEPPPTGKGVEF